MNTSEESPIDSIISRVESYIADPKMVTSETLGGLRDELIDLKSVLDGEETDESSGQTQPEEKGLAGAIKARSGG